MRSRYALVLFIAALSTSAAKRVSAQQTAKPAPVSVMVVGLFHMANPGHDLHNVQVDDVLAPHRQAEIAAINTSLAAFHPTKVMVEWPADLVKERYPRYLNGTLEPSRNEVVQLGFRLAHTAGLEQVYGIDADGDFPFGPVQAFAKAHGQDQVLAEEQAKGEAQVQTITSLLRTRSIAQTLRFMNEPAEITANNAFYRRMLQIGAGEQQPGADLLTAWYHRNFLICANLLENSRPGDHVVVFYGAGHAFLLRQCVAETPGYVLVEPNSFLPQ